MISGKLRNLITFQARKIPDSGFDNPAAWSIADPTVIENSKLILSGGLQVITTVPYVTLYAGIEYSWQVVLLTGPDVPGSNAFARVLASDDGYNGDRFDFGGTSLLDTPGTYTGTVTPSANYGLWIQGGKNCDGMEFESISITGGYIAASTVYANIRPIRASEKLKNWKSYGETTHIVTVRHSSELDGIDNTWRILFDGRVFVITGAININENGKTIDIYCSEGLRSKNVPAV